MAWYPGKSRASSFDDVLEDVLRIHKPIVYDDFAADAQVGMKE